MAKVNETGAMIILFDKNGLTNNNKTTLEFTKNKNRRFNQPKSNITLGCPGKKAILTLIPIMQANI